MKLKLAYFGTPDFSARLLEKLLTDKTLPIEVKLVVTKPDRPVGRKQILTQTPVKQVAEKYGIKVYERNPKFEYRNPKQYQNPNDKNSKRLGHFNFGNLNLFRASDLGFRASLSEVDLALVYAYGIIIPKEVLVLPKSGFWGIHPSLLPKYRGPSPIASALIAGDKETGVTIIKMNEKIDQGPIIVQEKIPILDSDKRPDLEIKLTDLAFEMFKRLVHEHTRFQRDKRRFVGGAPGRVPNSAQPAELGGEHWREGKARQNLQTATKLLTKKDGFIPFPDLNNPSNSKRIYNLFRGLFPWPGIWTIIDIKGKKKRLKITDLELKDDQLVIKRVQLEGKKETTIEQLGEF